MKNPELLKSPGRLINAPDVSSEICVNSFENCVSDIDTPWSAALEMIVVTNIEYAVFIDGR